MRIDLMLRAVADLTRLRVLQLLRGGELCVGDLVEILGVSQPSASRHLACLRKSGLVATRRHRLWTFYALVRPESRFHAKLLECLGACSDHLWEGRADAARAARLRASGGCCPEGAAGVRRGSTRGLRWT